MVDVVSDVKFALPGSWWRIPIQEIEGTKRSIRGYVDAVAGPRDDLAQSRAVFRQELQKTVEDARRVDGQTMYMSLELTPGVPTSISLTTYRPELPPRLSSQIDFDLSVESFAATLAGKSADDDISFWSADGVGIVRLVGGTYVTSEEGEQAENIKVDYWLLSQDRPHPTLAVFSSPLVAEGIDAALLDLFDKIVATAELPPLTQDGSQGTTEPADGDLAPSTETPNAQ